MRIIRLDTWSITLTLSDPYVIAYETVERTTNVFLRTVTDGPHVGLGCAAPDFPVTGETPADVLAALDAARTVLHGTDPTRYAALMARLRRELGFRPSALAALDMALLDLTGKAAGLPVHRLLGGARDDITTSVTIGILDERQTLDEARRWVGQGFRALKLKGGLDVEGDIVRVLKVREAVGPEVELSFDANQGFAVADALAFVGGCADVGLAYVEQPTPRGSPEMLAEVQRGSAVPIMADESLGTPAQAIELARGGCVKLFNVKLQKVGGLQAGMVLEGIGSAADIGLMVGCFDECALSIAAGAHFALARPGVRFADLDSHLTLPDDPTSGAVVMHDGRIRPRDGAGLGLSE